MIFKYIRASKSVLEDNQRLDALFVKTLLDLNAGKLLTEVINREIADKNSSERQWMMANQKKNVQKKKSNRQSPSRLRRTAY